MTIKAVLSIKFKLGYNKEVNEGKIIWLFGQILTGSINCFSQLKKKWIKWTKKKWQKKWKGTDKLAIIFSMRLKQYNKIKIFFSFIVHSW